MEPKYVSGTTSEVHISGRCFLIFPVRRQTWLTPSMLTFFLSIRSCKFFFWVVQWSFLPFVVGHKLADRLRDKEKSVGKGMVEIVHFDLRIVNILRKLLADLFIHLFANLVNIKFSFFYFWNPNFRWFSVLRCALRNFPSIEFFRGSSSSHLWKHNIS